MSYKKMYLFNFILPFILAMLFSCPDASAKSYNLKDRDALKTLKIDYTGAGYLFDKDSSTPNTAAQVDYTYNGGMSKIWTYASSWIGLCDSTLRGISFRDFAIQGNYPPGTKIKCDFSVEVESFGYINCVHWGLGDTTYYAKLNTGILMYNQQAWDRPAIGKTIFFASNDPNPPEEWAQDIAANVALEFFNDLAGKAVTQAALASGATSLVASAAGAGVGMVIGIVINVISFIDDAEKVEFAVSDVSTVEYSQLWLEIDKTYRAFLTLDTKVEALGTAIGNATSYVDFYNHGPHFGDDDGKKIPNRGFSVRNVKLLSVNTVSLPDDYVYPAVEVTEFAATAKPPWYPGEKVQFIIRLANKGNGGSYPAKARIKTPDPAKSFDINLYGLGIGGEFFHLFEYTFDEPGRKEFIVTVDPDKTLDKYIDCTVQTKYEFNVNVPLPNVEIQLKEVPAYLEIEKEVEIQVQVKNTGKGDVQPFKLQLLAKNKIISEQKTALIKPGEYEDFTFQWTPDEKGDIGLLCRVDPKAKLEDIDTVNNSDRKMVKVSAYKYGWSIKKGSLQISPANPKAGQIAEVYFTVLNNGQSEDTVQYAVFVNDIRIARSVISLRPESNKKIGLTRTDRISWKVTGGKHTVKVVLDPTESFLELKREGCVEELVISPSLPMPSVQGVDFLIQDKDVKITSNKAVFKVYNRGTMPGITDIALKQYSSDKGQATEFIRLRRSFPAQSCEDFSINLPSGFINSKLEIIIDPDNMVKEVSEKNNASSYVYGFYKDYEPEEVSAPRAEGPDLIVASISGLDRRLEVNEKVSLVISVGNLNMVDAGRVKVNYEFWNTTVNDITPSHGYSKGEKTIASVPKEGRAEFALDYKAVYPGSYKLTVWVDQKASVSETNEYNNTLEKYFSVGGEITSEMFYSGKGADLSIGQEVRVSNYSPSVDMPVTFEVDGFNNSSLDVWGADLDMFVNGKPVSGEPLGTFISESFKEVIFEHAFSATGSYAVKFMIDAKEAVPEANEANNTVEVTINVEAGIFGTGHRDVAVTGFSLSKSSCYQGEMITAKAIIKNLGSDPLRGVLCTIGPSGSKPFYVKIVPFLDAGEEIEISATLPALIAGEHVLEGRVDGKDIFDEENEENNIIGASITVTPITREDIKSDVKGAAQEKINQTINAVNKWLNGLGRPKK